MTKPKFFFFLMRAFLVSVAVSAAAIPAAAYAGSPIDARSAAIQEMFTIDPPPVAAIAGMAYLETRYTDFR